MKKRTPTTLRQKFIFIFLGLLALPLCLFGTLLFHMQTQITASFIQHTMASSVAQQADRLSQELYSVRSLSNLFYLDNAVVTALSAPGSPDADQLQQLSRKYTAALGRVHAQVSFLGNDGIYYGEIPAAFLPDEQELHAMVHSTNGSPIWLSSASFSTVLPGVSCVYSARPIHNRITWERVGTLLIAVHESELRKICSGYLSESQNAYLYDQSGHLLCSVNNQTISYVPPIEKCSLYTGSFTENSHGSQLVVYHAVNNTNWTLVISSSEQALFQPYLQSNQLFGLILLLYFCITLVLIFIMSKRFVQPIHELQKNIDLVKQGDLDTMVPVTNNDEIGQLSIQYNEMLQQIKALLTGLMDTQQAQHEAEMLALQAQINPHFIYNALASIRFLVFAGKKEETDKALLSLVNILHGTLSNPHALSTVGQELKLLQDYIDLQCISFSHPLSVKFDVDESIRSCKICKLTLQPIVENAFIHGFASTRTECCLTICAKDLGDKVEITISDNGVGFDPADFRPKQWSEETPHSGLGVDNVHERLQLTFGPEYGLRIESTPGKGTTVYVSIPKTQINEGDVLIYDSSDC